jgi:hypothetical protein
MLLVENRKPKVAIYLSAAQLGDKESTALYAAKEMRYYLDRITAASFQIEEAKEAVAGIYIGEASGVDVSDLGEEGFRVVSQGDRLCIAGGNRGVIYGVYEFLETLGCRFFTHNCEKIPTDPSLEIGEDYDICKKPAFEYRSHNYADVVQSPRFSVKCRFNGAHHNIPARMGGYMPYAWFVHTFEKMVPTEVYGESHPEYFALVNGERKTADKGRNQLCLTNPEVYDI